jgi:hypothetical protein
VGYARGDCRRHLIPGDIWQSIIPFLGRSLFHPSARNYGQVVEIILIAVNFM